MRNLIAAIDTNLPFGHEIMARALAGSFEVLSDRPEIASIISFTDKFLREKIRSTFSVEVTGDISGIHRFLSDAQRAELLQSVHDSLDEVSHIPSQICNLLKSLGVSDSVLLSHNVHLRLVFPEEKGTGGVPPHRDSWYALPAETVNIWIPCTTLKRNGVVFYPEALDRRIRLGPKNPENHHHEIPELELASLTPYIPSLQLGDCLMFCGNHLHGSLPNNSDATRISWDYRIVDIRTSAFYMRLSEFVYPDLIAQRPGDFALQKRETLKRIFRDRFILSIFVFLTQSMFLFKVVRRLKNITPSLFYR